MRIGLLESLVLAGLLLLSGANTPAAGAASFTFGSDLNGLTDLSSKSLSAGSFQMELLVHAPAGATFYENDSRGVTVNSQGLAGVVDLDGPGKINLLGGETAAATAESVQFSFNKPGLLTGINFDGVKDESLEYFILTSADGLRLNFFDSAANASIPGAVDSAISAGAVVGEVIYLLEINNTVDDEAQNLHIPFAAGQTFVITYGELGDEFAPSEPGNGARLQGITVAAVPEPASLGSTVVAAIVTSIRRREVRREPRKLRPGDMAGPK